MQAERRQKSSPVMISATVKAFYLIASKMGGSLWNFGQKSCKTWIVFAMVRRPASRGQDGHWEFRRLLNHQPRSDTVLIFGGRKQKNEESLDTRNTSITLLIFLFQSLFVHQHLISKYTFKFSYPYFGWSWVKIILSAWCLIPVRNL